MPEGIRGAINKHTSTPAAKPPCLAQPLATACTRCCYPHCCRRCRCYCCSGMPSSVRFHTTIWAIVALYSKKLGAIGPSSLSKCWLWTGIQPIACCRVIQQSCIAIEANCTPESEHCAWRNLAGTYVGCRGQTANESFHRNIYLLYATQAPVLLTGVSGDDGFQLP